jgi:hypothetical protein
MPYLLAPVSGYGGFYLFVEAEVMIGLIRGLWQPTPLTRQLLPHGPVPYKGGCESEPRARLYCEPHHFPLLIKSQEKGNAKTTFLQVPTKTDLVTPPPASKDCFKAKIRGRI